MLGTRTCISLAAALLGGLAATPAQATHLVTLDPSFGDGGRVVLAGLEPAAGAAPVARSGGGFLLGTVSPGRHALAVTALRADGRVDTSFGETGTASASAAVDGELGVAAVADAGDGSVLAAGSATWTLPHPPVGGHNVVQVMAVARFAPSGEVDRGFGGGLLLLPTPGGSGRASVVALLAKGGAMVGGSIQGGNAVGLMKLRANGSVDRNFGDRGLFVLDVAAGLERPRGLVVGPDGALTVAGTANEGQVFVARVLADGSALDGDFAGDGMFSMKGAVSTTAALGLLQGPDGRLLVPGRFEGHTGVLALDASGRRDRAFGEDGIAALPLATGMAIPAPDASVRPDGSFVVAAQVLDALTHDSHLVVTRFDPRGRVSGETAAVGFDGFRNVGLGGALAEADGGVVLAGVGVGGPAVSGAVLARLRGTPSHAPVATAVEAARAPRQTGTRAAKPKCKRTARNKRSKKRPARCPARRRR